MQTTAPPLLRPDPWTGFFEEVDRSSSPWRGLGRFRFQAQLRQRIGAELYARDELEAFMAAAWESPQEMRVEGDKRRWWAFEGNWYRTRADLSPADVAASVRDLYAGQLAEWGISASAEDAPPTAGAERPGPYLAVCSMFLDEASHLPEWLEFHLLNGVERFFLYDHESTDSSRAVLAPYVEEGTVVVHDWPVQPGQVEAFEDCAVRHRDDARWIAFIDVDEFLFSPTGQPLPEVLRAFERWPGVLVNRPTFGSSGHVTPPAGVVIESYLLRSDMTRRNRAGKTIADPTRLARCGGGHHWTYTEGLAVDERMRPAPLARGLSVTFSLLRLNHYAIRSREEFARKLATPRADTATMRTSTTFESIDAGLNDLSDMAAAAHGPNVREALRQRRTGASVRRPA
jgi:Glycosyltransferase family 92